MRPRTLIVPILLATALLAPVDIAVAADPATCEGETATIVDPGPFVEGTDGRDVIVATGATSVKSYGGDDLMCLTASPDQLSFANLDVEAGSGSDVVRIIGPGARFTYVELGTGADTYVGGEAADIVHAGQPDDDHSLPDADGAPDDIDTGAGDDRVYAGTLDTVFEDVVHLGAGADQLDAAGNGMTPAAVIDVGAEPGNRLTLRGTSAADVAIDAPTRNATLGGAAGWRWAGDVTQWDLIGLDGSLDLTGTDADEIVAVSAPRRIHLGGGDDVLSVHGGSVRGGGQAGYDGGPGTDRLELLGDRGGRTVVDLAKALLTLPAGRRSLRLSSLDDIDVTAQDIVVWGSGRADRLTLQGCRINVAARGGDDRVVVHRVQDAYSWARGRCRSDAVVDGGPGDDVVRADRGRDVLRGGPGRDDLLGSFGDDRVWGGPGRDRCSGEVQHGCEESYGGGH